MMVLVFFYTCFRTLRGARSDVMYRRRGSRSVVCCYSSHMYILL